MSESENMKFRDLIIRGSDELKLTKFLKMFLEKYWKLVFIGSTIGVIEDIKYLFLGVKAYHPNEFPYSGHWLEIVISLNKEIFRDSIKLNRLIRHDGKEVEEIELEKQWAEFLESPIPLDFEEKK